MWVCKKDNSLFENWWLLRILSLYEAVSELMATSRQSLTIAEFENFRFFMPQDIEWRSAG